MSTPSTTFASLSSLRERIGFVQHARSVYNRMAPRA
jgi:hypothetical protein